MKDNQNEILVNLKQQHEFKRLGGNSLDQINTPEDLTTELWTELQGTWVGNKGLNGIAVPSKGSKPDSVQDDEFLLFNYLETLTFTNAGAPARNRGGDVDQYVAALQYHQRVSNKETNDLLHVEDGMFLNLAAKFDNNGNRLPAPQFSIARSGTIPHGNSIMILGNSSLVDPGTFKIPPVSLVPFKLTGELNTTFGYTSGLINQSIVFHQALQQELDKPGFKIDKIIVMDLDSANNGGILSIPFINDRAKVVSMQATFWLEKVTDLNTKQQFNQLQYVQIMNLAFHQDQTKDPNNLIIWPHVTINTLVKQ